MRELTLRRIFHSHLRTIALASGVKRRKLHNNQPIEGRDVNVNNLTGEHRYMAWDARAAEWR